MRNVLKMLFPAVLLLSVSACTSTAQGIRQDVSAAGDWVRGEKREPVKAETTTSSWVPTGYAGQNKRGVVLKPLAAPAGGVQWNDVGDYSNYAAPQPVYVSDAVQVFGLDQAPPPVVSYDQGAVTVFGADYGHLLQHIYFRHGSAALDGADRAKIGDVARQVSGNSTVTVVGHASKRVDGVTDPVQRKMVNFEMAQKRAVAVTNALKQAGVSPAQVTALSKGEDEPSASTGGKSQEAADRRVEIYLK